VLEGSETVCLVTVGCIKAGGGEEAGEWVSGAANWDHGVHGWAKFVAVLKGWIVGASWFVSGVHHWAMLCGVWDGIVISV